VFIVEYTMNTGEKLQNLLKWCFCFLEDGFKRSF